MRIIISFTGLVIELIIKNYELYAKWPQVADRQFQNFVAAVKH